MKNLPASSLFNLHYTNASVYNKITADGVSYSVKLLDFKEGTKSLTKALEFEGPQISFELTIHGNKILLREFVQGIKKNPGPLAGTGMTLEKQNEDQALFQVFRKVKEILASDSFRDGIALDGLSSVTIKIRSVHLKTSSILDLIRSNPGLSCDLAFPSLHHTCLKKLLELRVGYRAKSIFLSCFSNFSAGFPIIM